MHLTATTSTKVEPEELSFYAYHSHSPSLVDPGGAAIIPAPAHDLTTTTSSGSSSNNNTSGWLPLMSPPTLAPSKRANWTRRLVITKQPSSEFYKDEGGKANSLDVEITLVEFDEHGDPARTPDEEFVDIPLRIVLFFESGKKVDDTDQEIFRFVGNDYDSVVIRTATRKASVQFRLEKVSRRKDGQRFKLRIEVDQEQCTANVADLTPIFTNAICVLSKRKHHSSYMTNDAAIRVKEPPAKQLKRDLMRLEEKMGEKIDLLLTEMTRMARQIQKQNELISKHLVTVPPALDNSNDSGALEWLFKSTPSDDCLASSKSNTSSTPNHVILPYFTVSDDSYDTETEFSGSSSDMSAVEVSASSPLLSFVKF